MRHRHCLAILSIPVVILSAACGGGRAEEKAAPSTPPPSTTLVSVEARIRTALEPLGPEYRRCYPLLVKLNAALAAGKGEGEATRAFNACQAPANEKTIAIVEALRREGLTENQVMSVVNQWRNEQMSSEAMAAAGKKK